MVNIVNALEVSCSDQRSNVTITVKSSMMERKWKINRTCGTSKKGSKHGNVTEYISKGFTGGIHESQEMDYYKVHWILCRE